MNRWWLGIALVTGCAGREPVRFGSPLLGMASVPPPRLIGAPLEGKAIANRADPMPREDQRLASVAAAAAITRSEVARTRASLPAPHRVQAAPPRVRTPVDLHDLVGRRETRSPFAATLAWAHELGWNTGEATTASEIIAWAERTRRLHGPAEQPQQGDLLIFDRATSDDAADLIAIVIGRDARGVVEMIYVAGGVVRRGFVDATRPAQRRDRDGAVLNTYLRHGKRQPPAGTRYLAGELLAHVVRQ